MIFDLSNPIFRQKAKEKFNHLLDKKAKIDLLEKRKASSGSQRRYIHLIFGWFGLEFGYTKEFVKREFFKKKCNSDLFLIKVHGKLGTMNDFKSINDLDTKEMTIAIERFRDWSSMEHSHYLPSPNEHEYLDAIENEIEMQKRWI